MISQLFGCPIHPKPEGSTRIFLSIPAFASAPSPLVNECLSPHIHVFHFWCNAVFMGLLTPTSNGCSMLVIPPGMTASSVLSLFKILFIASVLWHRKLSNTSRLLSLLFCRRPHTCLFVSKILLLRVGLFLSSREFSYITKCLSNCSKK